MRQTKDWLDAFCDYAGHGEAPRRMYWWVGVSCIAGALRRRVWIDQAYFQWHPNFYIILVAPPGIVSKSTTADTGMSLLRKVPGVVFGPNVVTWQALVSSFAAGAEQFEYKGTFIPMSAMTIASSELGNLLNPQDKDMVDMLVNLWDGKPFKKMTKTSGNDEVINPWLNIIACTTPDWIAGSFPEYMIGGGLTSRCIFVYADKKEKYIAYPAAHVPIDLAERAEALIRDLEHMSVNLCGEYALTPEAVEWGEAWYQTHYLEDAKKFDSLRFGGYVARKQTHMHKLAMVIAAARRDELVITKPDLELAAEQLTALEPDMEYVFAKIGMQGQSIHVQRLINLVRSRGSISYAEAFRFLQPHFPFKRELEDVINTCIAAGFFVLEQHGASFRLKVGSMA